MSVTVLAAVISSSLTKSTTTTGKIISLKNNKALNLSLFTAKIIQWNENRVVCNSGLNETVAFFLLQERVFAPLRHQYCTVQKIQMFAA